MRFSCEKSELQTALSIVQKAINAQNTLQVLGNIHIEAKNQKIHLSATNLEIAISTTIEGNISNEGAITLPSRLFVNYISLLKEGEVELELKNGDTVQITSRDSETKIKGISASEFPELPTFTADFEFTLSSEILKQSIERVVFACSASSARPVLSGVLFWGKEKELRLVGTDSYRLGEQIVGLENEVSEEKYIIPARTLQELSRIIQKDETVEIKVSKNQILFSSGTVTISSRLIEGNFPDYQRIIPQTHTGSFTLSRSDLIMAVKRVGIFAKEMDNNTIRISISEDSLNITTDETEIGSGNTNISGSLEGDSAEIALNALYLLDVLQVLHIENVVIVTGDSLAPVKVMPENEEGFTHILMPLKV